MPDESAPRKRAPKKTPAKKVPAKKAVPRKPSAKKPPGITSAMQAELDAHAQRKIEYQNAIPPEILVGSEAPRMYFVQRGSKGVVELMAGRDHVGQPTWTKDIADAALYTLTQADKINERLREDMIDSKGVVVRSPFVYSRSLVDETLWHIQRQREDIDFQFALLGVNFGISPLEEGRRKIADTMRQVQNGILALGEMLSISTHTE